MASCSLTRTTFTADTVMIESYLKLIIARLLELWQKTPTGETENVSLVTLHLQVRPLSNTHSHGISSLGLSLGNNCCHEMLLMFRPDSCLELGDSGTPCE